MKPFRFRGRFNRRGRNTRKMFFRLFRRIGAVAAIEKFSKVRMSEFPCRPDGCVSFL